MHADDIAGARPAGLRNIAVADQNPAAVGASSLNSAFDPTIVSSLVTKKYVLDGRKITSLDAFYDEFSRIVIPDFPWGRNLDAFDDVLSGGFGTPDEGFILVWRHASASKAALDHREMARVLELVLSQSHPSDRDRVRTRLLDARSHRGPTMFDWLLEAIRDHGSGGQQSEANVELVIEP